MFSFLKNHDMENIQRWLLADVLKKKMRLKILENLQASFNFSTSLSRHEQVYLIRLRFKRYFSRDTSPDDGGSISRNVA